MMWEYSICRKLTAACFIALSVMIGGMFMIPPAPIPITMGRFSEEDTEHKEALFKLSNCYGYEENGQYLFFKLESATRFNVVLKRKWHGHDHKSGVYFGNCKGLIEERLPDCPYDPPFILVTDVVSEPKKK